MTSFDNNEKDTIGNRLFICILGLIMISTALSASVTDSTKNNVTLGISAGLAQNTSFSADVFVESILPIHSHNFGMSFGYLHFKNTTDYSGVKDLEFSSHGLFTEGNYYFSDAFYGGLRFALNFNWVVGESQKKFDDVPDIDSPTFFTGIAGYMHLGYHQPIGKNIGIKLQGQIGLHNYKIAQGWLLVDNSSDDIRNAQFGIEKHAAFLYNLNVGFTYKF
jgi:hypothetical protein